MPDYVYHNVNPKQHTIEDCVCRAIKTATGLGYNTVINLLNWTSSIYKCNKLNVDCYSHLLDEVFIYRCYHCYDGETVTYIAKCFPNSKLIIRIDGHLTCSINGSISDIWDCSKETVDKFWVVE